MKQLIVITSEEDILNEASILNKLFKNGLSSLHLRKPNFSEQQYKSLINKINKEFHKKLVIHQFHHLCEQFTLGGIHLREADRLNLNGKLGSYIHQFQNKNFTVSSSFHSKEELLLNKNTFDYTFLSPIYNSISKDSYIGKNYDVNDCKEIIIALGGINSETLLSALKLGYSGVAVLGFIWKSNEPIQSFKLLKKQIAI